MKRMFVLLLLFLTACAPATATREQATVPPPAVVATLPTALPAVAGEPLEVEPTSAEPATLAPTAVVPTAVTIEEPTAVAEQPTALVESTPEVVATTSAVISGRTPEGAFFYGALDAPITLIDYSDFL